MAAVSSTTATTRRRQRQVTMRDLARMAGVSAITISRALSPDGATKVKPATRTRIAHLARKWDFRLNRMARALGGGSTQTIALILPDVETTHFLASAYYTTVVMHALAALKARQIDLKVHSVRANAPVAMITDLLPQLIVDGLLVAGIDVHDDAAASATRGAPLVLLNCGAVSKICVIDADNIAGGRLAVAHFLAYGHRALGMLCGPRTNRNARDRLHGYRAALQKRGVPIRADWFVHSGFGVHEGYAVAQRILALRQRPTALFCANDELALGVLSALRERGLRCPHDLAIIGFDDMPTAQYAEPPLTTIAQPLEAMVRAALDNLLTLIAGATPPLRSVFPVALVERASVATPLAARA